jgi:predicted RNA-binding protein YlxR (DUF448 family)
VQLDATGRLPGRGAYLCGRPACWDRALGRGDVLGRALRTSVSVEDREALLAHAPDEEETVTAGSAIDAVADAGSGPR